MNDGDRDNPLKRPVGADSRQIEGDYARPQQRWTCGRAAEGKPCPLGPTKGGRCRASYECAPYQQDDTWHCARTPAQGGRCQEGPLPDGTCCSRITPCRPVASLMARRGALSFCVFALAVGVVFIMAGSPQRNKLVSPGQLTTQHGAVVHGCDDCHDLGAGGPGDWVHAAFDPQAAALQNKLCLKCHSDYRHHPLHPHGKSTEELEKILATRTSGRQGSEPLLVRASRFGFGAPAHGELACATCHREHHGAGHDLTKLTDQQCQVCHQGAFTSLGKGHPEFTQFPYRRRTRLYFDHASHYGKHFVETHRADKSAITRRACTECHTADAAGDKILVRPFRQSCGECHQHQIEDDTSPGWLLANIPGLDVETLEKQGLAPGDWPTVYPLHVEADAAPSPLLRLLLHAHPEYGDIARQLADVDLRDLSQASPQQLQAAEKFAWAFKEMLYDVVQGGHPVIQGRLETVIAHGGDRETMKQMVQSFPLELLTQMQRKWLPRLDEEVRARRKSGARAAGQTRQAVKRHVVEQALRDERQAYRVITSGWYLRGTDLSLRYRPTGHADAVLTPLLEAGALLGDHRRLPNGKSPDDGKKRAMREMFASLASPFAGGRCMKCHTADRKSGGGLQIHWRVQRGDPRERPFTRFVHAPHTTLLDDSACQQCHRLQTPEHDLTHLYRREYIQSDGSLAFDPHRFESNFEAMTKSNCTQCHTRSAAGNRCMTCHNYHVR